MAYTDRCAEVSKLPVLNKTIWNWIWGLFLWFWVVWGFGFVCSYFKGLRDLVFVGFGFGGFGDGNLSFQNYGWELAVLKHPGIEQADYKRPTTVSTCHSGWNPKLLPVSTNLVQVIAVTSLYRRGKQFHRLYSSKEKRISSSWAIVARSFFFCQYAQSPTFSLCLQHHQFYYNNAYLENTATFALLRGGVIYEKEKSEIFSRILSFILF